MKNDRERSKISVLFQVFMLVLGAVFLLWTVFLIAYTNFDLGMVLTGLVGALFMVYGVFFDKINSVTKRGFFKAVKYSVVFGLCVFMAAAVFLAVYGNTDNTDYGEDALIVLGCGVHGDYPSTPLVNRLDAALKYSEKNKDAIIVVSGGQGFQESATEGSVMERYLIQSGCEPSRIIKEEHAASTYENMKFSKEILDNIYGANEYNVTILTNDYHVFRAVLIANSVGLKATHAHGKTTWYNIAPSYLREVLAIVKTLVLD